MLGNKRHTREQVSSILSYCLLMLSSRQRISNNYFSIFPSLENKSFSQGEIEILLNIFPAVSLGSMTIGGLEPMEKCYKGLIEHLEKLEVSLLEEVIPKKKKSKESA